MLISGSYLFYTRCKFAALCGPIPARREKVAPRGGRDGLPASGRWIGGELIPWPSEIASNAIPKVSGQANGRGPSESRSRVSGRLVPGLGLRKK